MTKAIHTAKMNDSLAVLEKLIAAEAPNTAKAIKALAQIQLRCVKAINFILWNYTEYKAPENKNPFGDFGGFGGMG